MFLPFLYELRRRGVPVGASEALALARALGAGLHQSALDGFYHVARSLLVHSEAHLDPFDEAFLAVFRGVETGGLRLREELREWLEGARQRPDELSPEERALLEQLRQLEQLDPDELRRLFEQRMREQDGRHDGGDRWIGTGGTSPFGHSGRAPQGIRVLGSGGARRALHVADARRYRPYRSDLTLDVRQMSVALRKLRAFAREGTDQELDLEGTIDATARNAGELEVVTRPPRRPNTRVVLLMDLGGSMEPYAHLVSRLFTAASKATHFKQLRCCYFHNCVYSRVYRSEGFADPLPLSDLLADCGRHYKLIVVGDALMAPYELFSGGFERGADEEPGIASLVRLAQHFERSVWLNPEPPAQWSAPTIAAIQRVFEMFPLTLDGLGQAVAHLVRGRRSRRRA